MNYVTEKNNKVFVAGEIISDAVFSHEVYGEGFYEFFVRVMRLSGQADVLPITISERLILDGMLELTGVVNDESVILLNIMPDNPLDLKALIFAAIIIGAVGAIMDVSISIASSLSELKEKLPEISMLELWKSGMTISRDIMGTMANTLILAYMGSCLTSVLLMVAYNSSLLDLFNRERIVVEMLQALVGSMGILLALPLTTLICAVLYRGK